MFFLIDHMWKTVDHEEVNYGVREWVGSHPSSFLPSEVHTEPQTEMIKVNEVIVVVVIYLLEV